MDIPWLDIRMAYSSMILSSWVSTMPSGMSASRLSTSCSRTACSKSFWASAVRRWVSFSPRSFLKSARVSNSDTSLANSSSTVGIWDSLTSLTLTLNTTALPARSAT